MAGDAQLTPRQIWAQPSSTTSNTYRDGCTPVLLPSEGYVYLNTATTLTLSENAVFEPVCTGQATQSPQPHSSAVLDIRDPFYSSTTPQLYVIGCATVISYLLVIILLISPRTFFVGGPGSGANSLSRHGIISRSYSGNSSVIGVGGRPWLQKVAALMVAISMTIASVDSFEVAERQYIYGYSDAEALSREVLNGTELRIVRVISSTFLWLAQVQTLIRLFPRHKEKILIKWAGFALIMLDTIFSCLDNFLIRSDTTRPRMYDDAIPALSYLFELALNLLYAAWVIFYSISKHRFAFFHPKMRSICFVALLSICSVCIPAVFFVLDIAEPQASGWGNYARWVGSAAASVVVWEWVERIEALEREETKDGILGREIFDGDEMLEVTPSTEVDWPRQPYSHGRDGGGATAMSSGRRGVTDLARRPLRTRLTLRSGERTQQAVPPGGQNNATSAEASNTGAGHPTPPPVVVTPVSRTDTTSASTVYNVRYHPVSSPSPVVMPQMEEESVEPKETVPVSDICPVGPVSYNDFPQGADRSAPTARRDNRWWSFLNPFRRRRTSLPREIASAQAEEEQFSTRRGEPGFFDDEGYDQESVHSGVNNPFSSNRIGRPVHGQQNSDAPLPVTVIPARRHDQQAWSPKIFDDSAPSESSRRRRHLSPVNSNLPVTVIPSQPRSAAPWTGTDGGINLNDGSNELRYDPETATLVGPGGFLPSSIGRSATHPSRSSSATDDMSYISEEHSISDTLGGNYAPEQSTVGRSGAQHTPPESNMDGRRATPG